jgi:hypothetical protein
VSDSADDIRLLRLIAELSPGDFANLKIALQQLGEMQARAPRTGLFGKRPTPDSDKVVMLTASGSANDKLFTAFVERGWMAPKVLDHLPPNSRAFALLSQGAAPIAALVAKREMEAGFGARIPPILREICGPFLNSLIDRVQKDGGHPGDVARILGIMLNDYARHTAREGQIDALIDAVATDAKALARRAA